MSSIDDFILEYVCEYPKEAVFSEARDAINELLEDQRETCASGLSLVAFNSPQGRMVYMDDAVKMCLTAIRK